jgi:hypothetical protein
MNRNPLWFLLNIYGWLIVIMSIITAFIVGEWWIVLLGVIGYQVVLLVEMTWGGNLGRTGRVRLARAEQENRELRAEQARLLGAIKERDEKMSGLPMPTPEPEEIPDPVGEPEPPGAST